MIRSVTLRMRWLTFLSLFACPLNGYGDGRVLELNITSEDALSKNFDVGEFDAGSNPQVQVRIINSTPAPFEFQRATVSCNCTKAQIPRVVVEPGQSAILSLEFSIDAYPKSLTKDFDTTIYVKGKPNLIHVKLSARISKVVAFPVQSVIVSIGCDEEEKSFRIPLLLSDKADFNRIRIEGGAKNVFLINEIRQDASGTFVHCKVDVSSLKDEQLVDELSLLSPWQEKPVALTCYLRRTEAIEISPRMLTFRSDTSPSQDFRSSAMVKVNGPVRQINSISAVVGNAVLEVEKSQLPGGLYRLSVATGDQMLPEGLQIEWRIGTNNGEYLLKTPYQNF